MNADNYDRILQNALHIIEHNRILNIDKPVSCLLTPNDVAMWSIVEDCFESTMSKVVGYEATLSNIFYDIKNVNDCAIQIQIQGFASKIFLFAEMFIDCLLEYANKEFEQS